MLIRGVFLIALIYFFEQTDWLPKWSVATILFLYLCEIRVSFQLKSGYMVMKELHKSKTTPDHTMKADEK